MRTPQRSGASNPFGDRLARARRPKAHASKVHVVLENADPRWGEIDRYLFNEGRHLRLWEHLGSHVGVHDGTPGVWFAVWAPDAQSVSVVGDFNAFDATSHHMLPVGSTGVWSAFVEGATVGQCYKYAVRGADGRTVQKADPLARATEVPPRTASVKIGRAHV